MAGLTRNHSSINIHQSKTIQQSKIVKSTMI